jgi:hypothetical protein
LVGATVLTTLGTAADAGLADAGLVDLADAGSADAGSRLGFTAVIGGFGKE